MPLVDAYIKCDQIAGGYKAGSEKGSAAKLDASHDGWSEIYSFKYTLDKDHPKFTITKPVDLASSDIYVRYLKTHSRQIHSRNSGADSTIDSIKLHFCRWIDANNDGIIDKFVTFLEYTFLDCRVLNYSTDIDFEADELPEERVTFGFRDISMAYTPAGRGKTSFGWNFMKAKEA